MNPSQWFVRIGGIILIFGVLSLFACSTAHKDQLPDQEGGISGTGHDINCQLAKNKNHPRCVNQ